MSENPLELLGNIKAGQYGGQLRPHKFALVLALIELYDRNPLRENYFYIEQELEGIFKDKFLEIAPHESYLSSAIENPFYFLQSDAFWQLHVRHGKENEFEEIKNSKNRRFTKGRILGIFSHATLSQEVASFLRDKDNRDKARKKILDLYSKNLFPDKETGQTNTDTTNLFVSYLNSLQRTGGSNDNSLAESQACNPQFATIHVPHPLADSVYAELVREEGRHIILTGHAGDGKSTIALDVFKRLKGLAPNRPLSKALTPHKEVGDISIIKDLSERNSRDDRDLLEELLAGNKRFLMVSNTGTLLDLVKSHAVLLGEDDATLESRILKAISSNSGEAELQLGAAKFKVFNLALMDNLELARKIFLKMLAPERWEVCEGCSARPACPVRLNVSLLGGNGERAIERIFLAYRRMYEYGGRLTIRQFTEHLAYMITAGLDEPELRSPHRQGYVHCLTEYLFFNRFFGDDGRVPDEQAGELAAVRAVLKQGFGARPSPAWEHRLWLRGGEPPVQLGVAALKEGFDTLRRRGSGYGNQVDISPGQAREQVRRMVFFLHELNPAEEDYLGRYLNSPTLLLWRDWQKEGAALSLGDKTNLERKIYHVLQEHFTGVRLPEGATQNDRRLYVTLSRRRSEVRQSAQIVLAQVDWSTSFALVLKESRSANGGRRRDLVLSGQGRLQEADLELRVPFLDYVMLRHFGELGEVLDASYLERLERFKAQVHQRAVTSDDERIMLVRLRTDHTFRRQHFSVTNGRLEVTDAL